ncbi:MAG TPA: hypothetical protein VKD72_07695 [Gemmataceae bacterium]|nr:hypothetical protein [Gemmataceae bacterium]
MSKQKAGVPVSTRALVQRINRKLKQDDERLKKCRSRRWEDRLGEWYRINVASNFIVQTHVDLEALGRELGVLEAWERLAQEEETLS